MNKAWFLIPILFFASCKEDKEVSSIDPVNWAERRAGTSTIDSLPQGKTYLSVYSQIYSLTEHKTHNLTATVSMRNTSLTDSLYITRADYYNTGGELLRSYFDHPIYIAPMETVEIVIDEEDREGGTGANFLFQWHAVGTAAKPLFEAVMISTSGQQGLSFTTRGIQLE